MISFLLAAVLFEATQGGVSLRLESETTRIDPSRSVFLRLELKAPAGLTVHPPDLRSRVRGFSVAEDFAEEPTVEKDGSSVQVVNWRLIPEPCSENYVIRAFVVAVDGGVDSFVGGPVRFEPPEARDPVTGGMEIDPSKDLPPLSWKLVGEIVLGLLVLGLVIAALVYLIRFLFRKVKEHRMSPIERAWVELDRLLKKGLPGRGRYKDFYVELTMVVRRYVQRRYGIRAPHLTTEEFLREARPSDALRHFLESSDLVKFAGVEATPEMAESATEAARGYLESDNRENAR